MRVGLCGAHRVGKTTLAEAYANLHGLPFIPTTIKKTTVALGADAITSYPIEERLRIQTSILVAQMHIWESHENAIFDRSPLCVLAYMEADILRNAPTTEFFAEAVAEYRNLCLRATTLFSGIFLVQPGIEAVDAQGSAPCCLPYMEHLNTLCLGYLHPATFKIQNSVLPRGCLALEDRLDDLHFFINTL